MRALSRAVYHCRHGRGQSTGKTKGDGTRATASGGAVFPARCTGFKTHLLEGTKLPCKHPPVGGAETPSDVATPNHPPQRPTAPLASGVGHPGPAISRTGVPHVASGSLGKDAPSTRCSLGPRVWSLNRVWAGAAGDGLSTICECLVRGLALSSPPREQIVSLGNGAWRLITRPGPIARARNTALRMLPAGESDPCPGPRLVVCWNSTPPQVQLGLCPAKGNQRSPTLVPPTPSGGGECEGSHWGESMGMMGWGQGIASPRTGHRDGRPV